jgi:hypothetical protein
MKKTLITLFVLLPLILTACASAGTTAQTPSAEESAAPPQEAPPQSQSSPSDEAPQAENGAAQSAAASQTDPGSLTYAIVDSGQTQCYADTTAIDCPQERDVFYGQDAQYEGNQPAYQHPGDG